MLELAAGIALWSCPPHIKIPGVVGLAALRGIRAKLREREEETGGNNNTVGDASSARDEVVVRWDDVRMTIQPTKKEKKKLGAEAKPKRILDGVSGAAKPGRLLAIMGPSGSGKTSLLNALAAQVPRSKRLTLRGTLRHDDVSVGKDTRRNRKRLNDAVAYVQQQDVFYSQLTVRETLETAAAMRMPTSTYTQSQRSGAVDDVLRAMGIAHVASSKVGDVKTRGVSGGEKKRLALACELVGGAFIYFSVTGTSMGNEYDAVFCLQVPLTSCAATSPLPDWTRSRRSASWSPSRNSRRTRDARWCARSTSRGAASWRCSTTCV